MSDISINYKGTEIANMSASGTKTLTTQGKYCEDNISVVYSKPQSVGQRITINFTQFKSYNTFLDLINDITPILVPNKFVMATWTFINNTENTRAGIKAVVCTQVDASGNDMVPQLIIICRVGYTATSLTYGVDVYAGATVVCDYMYGESIV